MDHVAACGTDVWVLRITNKAALPLWIMDSFEMEELIKECNLTELAFRETFRVKCLLNRVYRYGIGDGLH